MRKEISHSFSDTTVSWLNSKPQLAEVSRTAYKGEINRLAEHLARAGVREVPAVSREAWWSYLNCLEDDRESVSTKRREALQAGSIQQARRITRDFFMWALEGGIISWLPRLPDTTPSGSKSLPVSEAKPDIDIEMARVLAGDIVSKDMSECRIHLTLNLVFWGALKPATIAALKVRDFSKSGILTTQESERQQTRELPDHIARLWELYRKARKSRAGGISPRQDAPLICHLDTEETLSAWGIWAIFNEWHEQNGCGDSKMTPRALRAAYLDFVCSDGEMRLKLACAHGGVRERRVQAFVDDIPKGMVASVNNQIRSHFQDRLADHHLLIRHRLEQASSPLR